MILRVTLVDFAESIAIITGVILMFWVAKYIISGKL